MNPSKANPTHRWPSTPCPSLGFRPYDVLKPHGHDSASIRVPALQREESSSLRKTATAPICTRTRTRMPGPVPRLPPLARFVYLPPLFPRRRAHRVAHPRQGESLQLGSRPLCSAYLESSLPSYINDMRMRLVDSSEAKARVKAGVEGTVVFDSAIALLQDLFPPNKGEKIQIANNAAIAAPIDGR
ncbi:hypothetical protein C0993_003321 [Termitomyces sp. T159_Od127]|nr:hypothetical protein C0993_003321 [Termitomyces sp. T159_Od127]